MVKTTNAAIVWLRYRAKYGVSPLTVMQAMGGGSIPEQVEAIACIYSEMLKGKHKRTPQQLIEEWRTNVQGLADANAAIQTLFNGYEPFIELKESKRKTELVGKQPAPNDEYTLTARMAMAGLPSCLLYELPYYAIETILNRYAAIQPFYDSAGESSGDIRRRSATPEEVARFHGL